MSARRQRFAHCAESQKAANAKANNFSITRFPAAQLSARISQKDFDERPAESVPFFTRRDRTETSPLALAAHYRRNNLRFSHLER
jgi:hypothetical protein